MRQEMANLGPGMCRIAALFPGTRCFPNQRQGEKYGVRHEMTSAGQLASYRILRALGTWQVP